MRGQSRLPLCFVILHTLCVEDGQVRLAGIQVLLLVQPILHHVLVVADLQVLEVVSLQQFGIELPADDLSSNVVLLEQYQAHLIQDVFRLLSPLHGSKGFYLDLLQQVRSLFSVALGLFDLSHHVRQASLLNFHKDLALGDLVQGADELHLAFLVEAIEPTHDEVNHVRGRSLQLPPLFRQEHNVLLELRPFFDIIIRLTNLAKQLGGRDAVRSLSALFLQGQHLVDSLFDPTRLLHRVHTCKQLIAILTVVLGGLWILRQVAQHRVQVLSHASGTQKPANEQQPHSDDRRLHSKLVAR
mmetsp:Transcript_45188/g.130486  ORF Transcript_45188/g.130486 Transcript_45188/m.130486 type:complete len:299 (-) Transcript_45188:20-916(-)